MKPLYNKKRSTINNLKNEMGKPTINHKSDFITEATVNLIVSHKLRSKKERLLIGSNPLNKPATQPILYWQPNSETSKSMVVNKPRHLINSTFPSFNDYQYIKSKWLFELLTASFSSLHHNSGFLFQSPLIFSFNKWEKSWFELLLGNSFQIFNVVFPRNLKI